VIVRAELNNSHMANMQKKSPNKTKQKVPKNTLAFLLCGFKLVIRSYLIIRTLLLQQVTLSYSYIDRYPFTSRQQP